MKLIIGLGNPGKEYDKTRHNIGFSVVDLFAQKSNQEFNKEKFNSHYFKEDNILVLKPQTYMNLSGDAVQAVVKFFKIDPKDILVIYDEMNLPVGKFTIKPKGSAGGQNGMKDIINKLGTNEIARLRVGIGRGEDASKHVLSNFSKEEKLSIEEVKEDAVNAIQEFIKNDINSAMNKFN